MAKILSVRPDAPDEEVVRQAAEALLRGKTVAVPTDTVYGLCARAQDSAAVEALYALKGRDLENHKATPVLIGELDQLALLAEEIPSKVQTLMNELWPGPLTLILKARAGLSPLLVEKGGIGVRYPDQALCQALARAAGPFAATSANLPGEPPLLDAKKIVDTFSEDIPIVLDGGPSEGGVPSTVLNPMEEEPKVLREGAFSFEEVMRIWRESKAGGN